MGYPDLSRYTDYVNSIHGNSGLFGVILVNGPGYHEDFFPAYIPGPTFRIMIPMDTSQAQVIVCKPGAGGTVSYALSWIPLP
jgi:hypothetical protein